MNYSIMLKETGKPCFYAPIETDMGWQATLKRISEGQYLPAKVIQVLGLGDHRYKYVTDEMSKIINDTNLIIEPYPDDWGEKVKKRTS